MKKFIFSCLFVIIFIMNSNAQEITLYNSEGEPKAYIDYEEDATIFLWNGKRAAFLERNGEDILVYGYNKVVLGWYEDGYLYNREGEIVGSRDRPESFITPIEPIKGIQKISPLKPITPIITPDKPVLQDSWGSISLVEFLYLGII